MCPRLVVTDVVIQMDKILQCNYSGIQQPLSEQQCREMMDKVQRRSGNGSLLEVNGGVSMHRRRDNTPGEAIGAAQAVLLSES